ncbi:MAG: helix-turn-helix transcriptional regulator [Gemmatimonadota bacterium]
MLHLGHDGAEDPLKSHLDQLGERLARHRLNRNLTQAELARAAGISTRTVARLEGGDATQLENFLRVLMALGLGGALDRLVPDVPESPIQPLERSGRTRKRATGRRGGSRMDREITTKGPAEDTSDAWTWADLMDEKADRADGQCL